MTDKLAQDQASGGNENAEAVSSSSRFESGSLTEARWPAPAQAASKPAESSQSTHIDVDPALIGIAEETKESGGHWQPCSGCYDTEDGHPTQKYAFSPALQTSIGCGCHECGGLGAVWWHMTDAEIADFANICEEVDTEHQLTVRIARLEFVLRGLSKAYAACNGEDHPAYEEAQRALANTLPRTSTATHLVIVESPFAGHVEANVAYARAALRDCLNRGEAPYASHLLYTQPGVLDDNDSDQRRAGIEAGLAWGKLATATVVYTDRGISTGMQQGIDRAIAEGRIVEYRSIEKAAAQ